MSCSQSLEYKKISSNLVQAFEITSFLKKYTYYKKVLLQVDNLQPLLYNQIYMFYLSLYHSHLTQTDMILTF